MEKAELNQILRQLRLAGVRELRFTAKDKAVDQAGRTIVFFRQKVKGQVVLTFKILS